MCKIPYKMVCFSECLLWLYRIHSVYETKLIPDLFHVYLNKCEFHFSSLHVNKINNFCFLLNKGCVPCKTK